MSDRTVKKKMPGWTGPMLATLTEDYFSDPDWIYERKLDGVRCLVFKDEKNVRILSRNKNQLNNMYPEIEKALLSADNESFIADGELVTFDGELTSFSRLQQRINVSDPSEDLIKKVPVILYLFDLLYQDGYDLTRLPLRERKSLLKKNLKFTDPIRFCAHINENGMDFYKEACEKGWEGIIAKRADSVYHHSRSKDWLKFKCVHQQEFVVVGYTEPRGERKGFGAMLVAYYEKDQLHYAGKVGTGYSDKELSELYQKMSKLKSKKVPLQEEVKESGVHWIRPELVAEIGFTEWTNDHKLRHPRYLGLRQDKSAREVIREAP